MTRPARWLAFGLLLFLASPSKPDAISMPLGLLDRPLRALLRCGSHATTTAGANGSRATGVNWVPVARDPLIPTTTEGLAIRSAPRFFLPSEILFLASSA